MPLSASQPAKRETPIMIATLVSILITRISFIHPVFVSCAELLLPHHHLAQVLLRWWRLLLFLWI